MPRLAFTVPLACGLLLLTSACYTANRFQEEQAAALCDLYEQCGYLENIGVSDYATCVETMLDSTYQCNDYDASAAADCVEGLEALTCERHADGYYPEGCDEVCSSTVTVD